MCLAYRASSACGPPSTNVRPRLRGDMHATGGTKYRYRVLAAKSTRSNFNGAASSAENMDMPPTSNWEFTPAVDAGGDGGLQALLESLKLDSTTDRVLKQLNAKKINDMSVRQTFGMCMC